jgi:hypothetical protein
MKPLAVNPKVLILAYDGGAYDGMADSRIRHSLRRYCMRHEDTA